MGLLVLTQYKAGPLLQLSLGDGTFLMSLPLSPMATKLCLIAVSAPGQESVLDPPPAVTDLCQVQGLDFNRLSCPIPSCRQLLFQLSPQKQLILNWALAAGEGFLSLPQWLKAFA